MTATTKTGPSKKSSTTSRSNAANVQARLSVGRSNDHYEQEADRVADTVVNSPTPSPIANKAGNSVQRSTVTSIASAHTAPRISKLSEARTQRQEQEEPQAKIQKQQEEEAQAKLQRQAEEKEEPQTKLQRQEEEEPVQTKKEARANIRDKRKFSVLGKVEKKLFEKKGQGEKLDNETKTSMEVGMGADFRDVKIHKDADAVNMNRELRAQAFTHGKDIFFNAGKFEPEASSGKQLLAHELTHVVQQGAAEQKIPEETVDENNAKRLQPPPEPSDKEALETEKQTDLKIQENKPEAKQAPKTDEAVQQEASEKDAEKAKEAEQAESPKESKKKGSAKKAKISAKKQEKKKSGTAKGTISKHLKKVTKNKFEGKKNKISKLARNEKQKESPENKLKQTEKSVIPPAEESQSRANATQVETVEASKAPEPDEQVAKQQFDDKMQNAVPSTLEEVDKFKEEGKGRVVGEAVKEVVTADTQEVRGTYQEIENTPDPQAPEQEPENLPEVEAPTETATIEMGEGVVGEVLPEHTDMSEFEAESDNLMEQEGIKEEQLEMVDEGELAEAKAERKNVKTKAKEGPSEVKQFEQTQKQNVNKELQKEEQGNKQKMRAQRQQALLGAKDDQSKTKSKLELKRQKVTDHINGIYQKVNDTVKQKLETLETQALKAFDDGEKQATKTFENNVERRINAFKSRRYDRFGGSLLWAKDKLFGMDDLPEVEQIFNSEKTNFVTAIDSLIKKISAENTRVIQECKDLVANARKQIEKFVTGLGPELQQAGQSALQEMKGKLDALDKNINKKEQELKKKLEEKREAAIKAIEEKIEKMKEEMSGLISKLGNLLLNAMMKFFKWALKKAGLASDQLMGIIYKGKTVIKKIVSDPIGFIGNIITAIKNGIGLFQANIKKHLVSGLIGWLTGAMADLPIQLPAQFNLKGILSLVLQILGLTWDRIRTKLVKRLGERVVKIAETSVDIVKKLITEGPMALWEMIKEKAGEIKTQVMEGIRNWVITNVIKQGIIKLVSFLNPAGAILQAILAIYNTVMFFVENWQRIVDFVKSVFDSIGNIAMGKLSAAASLIERAMGMTIPIIMNFLSRLMGLSGIGKAVSKVITKIRKPIDKIVRKVIDKIVQFSKKLLRKTKKSKQTTPAETKKHTKFAKEIVTALQAAQGKSGFDKEKKEKKQQAKRLEGKYSPKLGKGIKVSIKFKADQEDKKDNDIDFEVVIAPNTTRLSGKTVVATTLPKELKVGNRLEYKTSGNVVKIVQIDEDRGKVTLQVDKTVRRKMNLTDIITKIKNNELFITNKPEEPVIPARRYLPVSLRPGSKFIRPDLYEAHGWSTKSKSKRNADTPNIINKVKAAQTSNDTAQWSQLKAQGLVEKAAFIKSYNPANIQYQTDHEPDLALQWNKSGYDADDSTRKTHVLSDHNLRVITKEANLGKTKHRYNLFVGKNFFSTMLAVKKNSEKIQGKSFLDDKGKAIT